MKYAFNIDSKFWKFFDYAGDLILLNFLFLLTSIPVVTAGASITAMNSVLFKKKEKRTDDVKTEFFRDFKENFKSSTAIWLIFLVFALFCALNFVLAARMDAAYRSIIFLMLGAAAAVMLMTVLYSFAMLARFENDWLTTAAKAFVISIMSMPYTIGIMFVLAAGILASIQTYLTMLAASAVWLLIGFALEGFLCCEMFYRAFRRFTLKEDLAVRSEG